MLRNKLFLLILLLTVLLLGSSVFLLADRPAPKLDKTSAGKLEARETSFDFGDIAYSGGVTTHSFEIKNVGEGDLQITNMATSCMCTKVYLKQGQTKSPEFGMKGMSKTSSWMGVLKSGETGEVVAEFDPAYHGPQGMGQVSRLISFETNDLDHPYIELEFKGWVK